MRRSGMVGTWAATHRMLVCIDSGDRQHQLVRRGARLAEALNAEWLALCVEPHQALQRR